jgi:hypothetical protein
MSQEPDEVPGAALDQMPPRPAREIGAQKITSGGFASDNFSPFA